MKRDETVLVCDPDPAERGLLRRALQRGGRRVHVASGPQEAMRSLASGLPDLVVIADRRSDSQCPELAAWIRTACPETLPLVALVPHHDRELTSRCYEAGCDLVVATPLDIDSMCLALDALLRRAVRHVAPAVDAEPLDEVVETLRIAGE